MMKQTLYSLLLVGTLVACKNKDRLNGEQLNGGHEANKAEWLHEMITAWELMANNVLKLPPARAPIMLFYDTDYVYTTSGISAPNGEPFEGPTYFGEKLPWKKQAHNDTLIIPDGQRVPVQLMTFAAPSKEQGMESFFVMAAPAFWKKAGIESEEVGLKKMLIGIFLHEFAHTRQMNGIGRIITEYERKYDFDFPVSDDLIQEYFSDDSSYVKKFNKEVELLYSAVVAKEEAEMRNLAMKGMTMLKARQKEYLAKENNILVEMDDIFLTMEGIGQYMIVSYLESAEGGNVPKGTAIKAARRGKKWWSQDEGLALVLLYERLVPNPDWRVLFNENPMDIVALIEKELH